MIAHYRGDCTADVVGQVMGPDTAGGYVQAVEATFDPEQGRTTARFRPVPPDQLTQVTLRPGELSARAALLYLPLPERAGRAS